MKKRLKSIIIKAGKLGLPHGHLNLAREFLDGYEFGLRLDTIVTLFCEERIKIDEAFYLEVEDAARKIGLEPGKAEKLKELT